MSCGYDNDPDPHDDDDDDGGICDDVVLLHFVLLFVGCSIKCNLLYFMDHGFKDIHLDTWIKLHEVYGAAFTSRFHSSFPLLVYL